MFIELFLTLILSENTFPHFVYPFQLMTLNESLSESDRELVEVKEIAELANQQAASTISTQVAFLNRVST